MWPCDPGVRNRGRCNSVESLTCPKSSFGSSGLDACSAMEEWMLGGENSVRVMAGAALYRESCFNHQRDEIESEQIAYQREVFPPTVAAGCQVKTNQKRR